MKRILIFYSHFAPSFKGGGPIQSLINLVDSLNDDYFLDIVCSAYEMGESEFLDGIKPDGWNQYNTNAQVFYASSINYKILTSLIKESNPDVVYINGMFLPLYNWLPLYIAKKQNRKMILAPRGMLQQGALAVKPLKKKIFLSLFKFSGLYKNITWHATDEQEQLDIKKIFSENADVKIALNIPKPPLKFHPLRSKSVSELKLVYLSLITEKKNLHIVLQSLKEIKTTITFDIYGPVKDVAYWQNCQSLMQNQIHNIQYKGTVNPYHVQSKLQEYHAFILPTKGENFGHAIYEALSAGTIPIISAFTPWGNLQQHQAGFTIDSWNIKEWERAIDSIINLAQQEFDVLSQNAFSLAKNYFDRNDFKLMYRALFE